MRPGDGKFRGIYLLQNHVLKRRLVGYFDDHLGVYLETTMPLAHATEHRPVVSGSAPVNADRSGRPLDRVYQVVPNNAIVVKIREGQVSNRPVHFAVRIRNVARRSGGAVMRFQIVRVPREGRICRAQKVELIATAGPGDHGEPVVTITQPGKD